MKHGVETDYHSGSLPPAVVVGLTETGLGLVRALGRKGIQVIGVDANPKIAGARTRYCSRVIRSSTDDEGLIETLLALGREYNQKPVLLLSEDPSVILVSDHMDRLRETYRFILPEKHVIDDLMYKHRFLDLIQSYDDIPRPDTVITGTPEEVRRAGKRFEYPCIIKPCIRTNAYNEHVSEKGFLVSSADELNDTYRLISPWEKKVIIQEWIPGDDSEIIFCLVYFDASARCRAVVAYRKLRQWHPETGSTSSGVTIRDAWVEEKSIRFFESVGFRGLGSTEFKRDPRDGLYKIVEPCVGRANLASYIAVEAGVNIPYLYYGDAIGRPLESSEPVVGVKWVHEVNDVRSALHYLRKGKLSIREWIRSIRGPKTYAFFCWDDPMPFLVFVFDLFVKMFVQLKRRLLHPSRVSVS